MARQQLDRASLAFVLRLPVALVVDTPIAPTLRAATTGYPGLGREEEGSEEGIHT